MRTTVLSILCVVFAMALIVCVGLLVSAELSMRQLRAELEENAAQVELLAGEMDKANRELITLRGSGTQQGGQAESLSAQRLYYRIGNDLSDMHTQLAKLEVSASPKRSALLLAELWRLSGSASTALAELPAAHGDSHGLTQFVTRVGDYAYSLMQSVMDNKPLGDNDVEQLIKLREYCGRLADGVRENISKGELPSGTIEGDGFYSQSEDEESITEYPSLIYDGPFSESNELAEPLGLEGEKVDEAFATELAKRLFPEGELKYDGLCNGTIVTHDFSVTDGEGKEIALSITETGGKLLYFMGQPTGQLAVRPSDEESQKLDEAARSYLESMGYRDMEPSYAQYYAGSAVLNYAATQDGVILYSDLIKVYVDRDSLEVFGLDARGYMFCHRMRELAKPALSEAQAKEKLSLSFTVEKVSLTLIPKTAATEVLCYEFKGKKGEDYYIVYINAESGAEEEIFMVINSEEGDLVV